MGAASVLIDCLVNPILFGLGDLSASAQLSKHADSATRSEPVAPWWHLIRLSPRALLVANGVPSLTGYQVTGPNRAAWHKRSTPSDRCEDRWNRGASYLRITFDRRAGLRPIVTNPTHDIINISTDPCDLGCTFAVEVVVSVHTLTQPCLEQISTFEWSGVLNHVHAVNPSD